MYQPVLGRNVDNSSLYLGILTAVSKWLSIFISCISSSANFSFYLQGQPIWFSIFTIFETPSGDFVSTKFSEWFTSLFLGGGGMFWNWCNFISLPPSRKFVVVFFSRLCTMYIQRRHHHIMCTLIISMEPKNYHSKESLEFSSCWLYYYYYYYCELHHMV